MSFVIACVGKPSAGKSSFLNAVTDATAKVGNYPFTTITPNQGIAYYPIPCACSQHNKQATCKPRHGWCKSGRRFVPVKILDVAGLVPGASTGKGLGNQFLDDLRHADVLIHVVDASGTTDSAGKETKGYDPIDDIRWLRGEIHDWVYANLKKKWGGIVRRHLAVKSTNVDTLHAQFTGYGTAKDVVQRAMDLAQTKTDLSTWTDATLSHVVSAFLDVRFPTIVALNKIDMPDSDRNIASILKRYASAARGTLPLDGVRADDVVLTSALGECFLRKMSKQKYIWYEPGDDDFVTKEEDADSKYALKEVDEKVARRLENIRDLVLFRYGSTGVQQVVVCAVEALGVVPVYPVKSLSTFSASTGDSTAAFQDCILVRPGTTVREFAKRLHNQLDRNYTGAETVGGIQLAEDDVIVAGKNNIIKVNTCAAVGAAANN